MSAEEKTGKEVQTKKSDEKEQPTQKSTKSENSSKDSRKNNKSKIKTAEKIPSSRRNVDEKNSKFKKSKSLKLEKGGTKEKGTKERSKEIEDMPPTANSAKSPTQNQKKKKQKTVPPSKTVQTLTPIISNTVSTANGSMEDGKIPALTPTPDVAPNKTSKVLGVIEPDEEAKKAIEILKKETNKKKKTELKRETNEISHLRPGINKNAEHDRRRNFEQELIQFETGEFTYLTDPTRYRFRSTPPLELVIQYVFPSLLLLAIMLASVSCFIFLRKEYNLEMEFNEMSEVSLSKYDSYLIVESITEYLQSEKVLRENNCPGLIQGPWKELDEHEFAFLKFESKKVKKAMKALTFRWIPQVEAVMNMNFDCPPSVILEVY